MSRFPERFGPEVQAEEIDLDTGDVTFRGQLLTESRAEEVAAEVLGRAQGAPPVGSA